MLGWVDTVRFLLERGANHGQVNAVGETCLHLACKHSHEEVVQLLLETAQVDINARDSQVRYSSFQLHEAHSICPDPVRG
eukprot:53155-Eustigmatos_ZCMA.PRE.1